MGWETKPIAIRNAFIHDRPHIPANFFKHRKEKVLTTILV
jgi:hypothetical protein